MYNTTFHSRAAQNLLSNCCWGRKAVVQQLLLGEGSSSAATTNVTPPPWAHILFLNRLNYPNYLHSYKNTQHDRCFLKGICPTKKCTYPLQTYSPPFLSTVTHTKSKSGNKLVPANCITDVLTVFGLFYCTCLIWGHKTWKKYNTTPWCEHILVLKNSQHTDLALNIHRTFGLTTEFKDTCWV